MTQPKMIHAGRFPQARPRRLRQTETLRRLVRETSLSSDQLVMPYFVQSGKNVRSAIQAMPGQYRYSTDALLKETESLIKSGVRAVLLFGIPDRKDAKASGAWSSKGVVQQTVRAMKKRFPELCVMTDVCLCAYTDHGHCGVINAKGEIDNDASLPLLSAAALSHAEAGADLVAPSDMMDGRIKAIRSLLDQKGFSSTPIMSYSAKYASSFYGPFRDAAHSAPQKSSKPGIQIPADRKSYQMDPSNIREAIREMALDADEGADILMVKPALAYMDIIRQASQTFPHPLAAYLVSGEYAMVKAGARQGFLDEKSLMLEIALSIKRAGADILITYHAKNLALWLPAY